MRLGDGTSLTSALVVLATGVRYRRLDVPRADYFEKMSVYYAASQAEALVCAGDPVVIVGGGNSAGQAAVFLSAHATEVTLIVREGDLGEHMSRYLVDRIARIPNVHVMTSTEVRELHGEAALEAVTVSDDRTGTRRTIDARALFVFIGMAPCTGWLGGLVDLDDHGFVRTGPHRQGVGRSRRSARCWRPAGQASSRSATCARLGQTSRHGRRRGRDGDPACFRTKRPT